MRPDTFDTSNPRRRAIGWAVVLLVHALVGWALITGTARQGLEILKKPLEAVVIQEVIIPPPPPPPPPPPRQVRPPEPQAPRVEAAPPPYVPPPPAAPPAAAPAIAATPALPPVPPVVAPAPAPMPAPAPAPRPARSEMGAACPTQVKPEMPPQAIRQGLEGVVRAEAVIRDGVVREVNILSGPRVFHASVRSAMLQYRCVKEAAEVRAVQEFAFRIE